MRSGFAGALPAYTAAALASPGPSLSLPAGGDAPRAAGWLLLLGLRAAGAALPAAALPFPLSVLLLLLLAGAEPLLPTSPVLLLLLLLLLLPPPSVPPCMAWKAASARSHCPPRPSAEMRRL